jgi:single-strand DNA-binding protein
MYNQCTLIGRLGADVEARSTQGGKDVANFNMATSEKWKDRNIQERTEWHRIVVWGTLAKACSNLRKGQLVHVVGRIQSRSFEHGGQTKYVTEIKADTVIFLERGERGGEQSSGFDNARPQARPPARGSRSAALPDGMPF